MQPDAGGAVDVGVGGGAFAPGDAELQVPALVGVVEPEAGAAQAAGVVAVAGDRVVIEAAAGVVVEEAGLPVVTDGVAQFEGGEPGVVRRGFALRVGAHAGGAAERHLLRAVEILAGGLAEEVGVEADVAGEALQPGGGPGEFGEAASGVVANAVNGVVFVVEIEAAAGEGEAALRYAAAEESVEAVAGEAEGDEVDGLAAARGGDVDVVVEAFVFIEELPSRLAWRLRMTEWSR